KASIVQSRWLRSGCGEIRRIAGRGADHGKAILPKLHDECFTSPDQAHYPHPGRDPARRLDHGDAIVGLSSSRQVAVGASTPVIRQAVAPSKGTGVREAGHGQGQARSIQRWRHRDHHHDHGAGAQGAGRTHAGRPAAACPGAARLRVEFRLRRHLLEQPSPHAVSVSSGVGCRTMGEPASAVLAVAVPVHHRLDGRKLPGRAADRGLWRGVADGGDCVLDSSANPDRGGRRRFDAAAGDRFGLEGQALAGALRDGHRAGLLAAVGGAAAVCADGAAVADPGPAHRGHDPRRGGRRWMSSRRGGPRFRRHGRLPAAAVRCNEMAGCSRAHLLQRRGMLETCGSATGSYRGLSSMADVFVSYARSDKQRVAPLVAAIEARGWSVWWDPEIAPGQEFDDRIEAEIDAARAVLVVWTPTSVASRWVRGEAREAAERGILVPVRFEQARLPLDVRAIHTTDLDGCGEDPASAPVQEFLRALGAMILRTQAAQSAKGDGALALSSVDQDARRCTICVLPFTNMSGDPEQEYFSDGITEDIITDLSKVSALGIISRNSAFMYKGRHVDIPKVARELKVSHVLEGSVRKAGG